MLVKEVSGFCCLNEPVSGDVSGNDTGAVMAEVALFMPIVLLASVLEVYEGMAAIFFATIFFFFKVCWHAATLFISFYINRAYIRYYTRRAPLLISY